MSGEYSAFEPHLARRGAQEGGLALAAFHQNDVEIRTSRGQNEPGETASRPYVHQSTAVRQPR